VRGGAVVAGTDTSLGLTEWCGGAYVAGRHTLSQQECNTLGAQLQHFSVYMIPL
jgi:hypothetical protein